MALVIQLVVLMVVFNISFIQTDASSEDLSASDGIMKNMESTINALRKRHVEVEKILNELQFEVHNIKRHYRNVDKELKQIKQMQDQQNDKTKNLIKEITTRFQTNTRDDTNRLSRRSMEILKLLNFEVYNNKRHQENENNNFKDEIQQIKQKIKQQIRQNQENVVLRKEINEIQRDHISLRKKQTQLLDVQEEQNVSFCEELNTTVYSIKGELMRAVIEEIRTHFQTKDCGPAPDVNNSISTITNTNAGQAATYRCMDGFRLGGSPAIVFCQHNGSWSDVLFFCDKDFVHQGISDLRLSGNSSSDRGRVEVLYSGIWGTICNDGWDDSDAEVVCKEIGFRSGTAKHGGHFGQGRGQVWIGNVDCNGTETKLDDCQFGEWGNLHCGHNQDAGVVCFN